MRLRRYRTEDLPILARLFGETVRQVNCRDYTLPQVEAWAAGEADLLTRDSWFQRLYTLVAEAGGRIVGYGNVEDTGYLEEDVCFAGNVGLTAADIREVQLAKGAIRAGMETLLAEEKMDAAGLEGLYVAGGFGSYMSAKSAERIGLFPKIDLSRIKICGNAALAGAVRILHDRRMEKEATALAERAKTINLGTSAKFQEFYMEYMMFDE